MMHLSWLLDLLLGAAERDDTSRILLPTIMLAEPQRALSDGEQDGECVRGGALDDPERCDRTLDAVRRGIRSVVAIAISRPSPRYCAPIAD